MPTNPVRFGPGRTTGNSAPDLQLELARAIEQATRGESFVYRHGASFELDGDFGGVGASGEDTDITVLEQAGDGSLWYQAKKTAAAGGGTAVFDIPGFSGAATCMVGFSVKRGTRYKASGPARVLYDGSATPVLASSGGIVLPSGTAGDQTQVALVLSISSGKLRLTFTNSHGSDSATVIVDFTRGRNF